MLEVPEGGVVDVPLDDFGQGLPTHCVEFGCLDVRSLKTLWNHLNPGFNATMGRVVLSKTGFKLNTVLPGQDTITSNNVNFSFSQGLHNSSILVRELDLGHAGLREEPVEVI